MRRAEDEATQELESLRRRLAVQSAVAHVLARTSSMEEAIPILLEQIGRGLGWDLGAFWEPRSADNCLYRTAQWYSPVAKEFVEQDPGRTFRSGEGLPGIVWSTGKPQIIEDLRTTSNFPRQALAGRANLRTAMAFPVHIGNDFFGVLEFFSGQPQLADVALLDLMDSVGLQLGQFVQRRRAETAKLESESRFRIFAETASDATFTINAESIVLYANPSVERIFGYKPEELVGRPLGTIMPERMRAAHAKGVARYLATGKRNISWNAIELPGLHKDGHEVPLEISFGEFEREGQRFFTGIARDITERDRYQRQIEDYAARLSKLVAELEARTDEAEAASRSKSLFLANMSHEIRTPINAIIGYGELLQLGIAGSLNAEQAHHLERIRLSAKHLQSLISDILDISKIEAGQFTVNIQEGNMAADVEAALSLVRPQATAKDIKLHHELPERDTIYLADIARVRQILVNLLSNAVKFTDRGGTIWVRYGTDDPEAPRDPGEWISVSVEDTGIGIPPEELTNVFRPFVQASTGTTRTHGGTGLGLSISLLARLMNGTLTVRSTPGVGSTFTLTLPASAETARPLTNADPANRKEWSVASARQIGLTLIRDVHRIVATYVHRVRSDPRISETRDMEMAEIADHVSSLIADFGQVLTVVGELGDHVPLLRDSSEIQRLISERHGVQRARHGRSEEALRREFVIFRTILENYVRENSSLVDDAESAFAILERLITGAEQISVQSFHAAVAAGMRD